MESGENVIRTQDILDVYERILRKEMSFDEAHIWAARILRLHEEDLTVLEKEPPSRDWSAIMFLLKVDIQIALGEYMYCMDDVEDALLRFMPDYPIEKLRGN